MQARILPAPALQPFGEAADACPWLDTTLGEGLRQRLTRAGCTVVREDGGGGEALVVGGELAANTSLLGAFLEASEPETRCVLAAGAFGAHVGIEDEIALPLYRSTRTSREALEALKPVTVDADVKPFGFDGSLEVPVPRNFGLPVTDWSRLLWANLFGIGAEVLGAPKSAGIWFVLRTLLKARSLDAARLAAAASVIHRKARVHPAAVVEASAVGEGAQIGPGACVRGSIVGAGARVESLADVTGSVLAPGAVAQRQAMVRFSVLFPRAFVGGTVQLSVFGNDARFHGGSYAMDMNLDGAPVKIRTADGELRTAGVSLGGCLGHDAIVGSGVWLAPGRVIPNGVIVVRDPDRIVRRIPENLDAGVPMTVREGRLVPTEKS